jgi:hypothetical protein
VIPPKDVFAQITFMEKKKKKKKIQRACFVSYPSYVYLVENGNG